MATVRHNKHLDFHWTASELFWSFLMGVAIVVGLWLMTGLVIGLFFL